MIFSLFKDKSYFFKNDDYIFFILKEFLLLGIVILEAISLLLDLRKINPTAISAPVAVTCTLTVFPSLIEEHLLSTLKLELSID